MTKDQQTTELERKIEKLLEEQARQGERLDHLGRDLNQLKDLINARAKQLDNKIQYITLRLSVTERMKALKRKLLKKVPVFLHQTSVPRDSKRSNPLFRAAPTQKPGGPAMESKRKAMESLPLEMSILMNWECNYHCSYCFAYKPQDRSEFRMHSAQEWENALLSIYRTHGKCKVVLTGGEPLLYPDAVDLVIRLTRYHHVSVGTNLSVDKETLRRISLESDLKNLMVSSSFHLEHASLESFMEKCLLLKEHRVPNWSSAVAYPEYLDEMPKIKSHFEKKGLGICFFPYLGPYKGREFPDEYSEQELNILRQLDGWHAIADHSRQSQKIELPRTQGILCYTGIKFISVDPRGDVRRCMPVDRVIGNVFQGDLFLAKAPLPCPLDVCNCEVYWKYHLR